MCIVDDSLHPCDNIGASMKAKHSHNCRAFYIKKILVLFFSLFDNQTCSQRPVAAVFRTKIVPRDNFLRSARQKNVAIMFTVWVTVPIVCFAQCFVEVVAALVVQLFRLKTIC